MNSAQRASDAGSDAGGQPSSTLDHGLLFAADQMFRWGGINAPRTMGSYVTPWMDKLHKSSYTNNFYVQNHSSSKSFFFTSL
jgi:hypothetical protein